MNIAPPRDLVPEAVERRPRRTLFMKEPAEHPLNVVETTVIVADVRWAHPPSFEAKLDVTSPPDSCKIPPSLWNAPPNAAEQPLT